LAAAVQPATAGLSTHWHTPKYHK